MEQWKKTGKKILFPHISVLFVLLPVSTVFMIWAMLNRGSEHPLTIASYVVAAYTLTIWCVRIPNIIKGFKRFKNENRYIRKWREDVGLRVNVSLYGTLLWNVAYAVFQLGLGYYHASFWFYSLAAYYVLLALMRFFLVRHTRKHGPGENMAGELKRYRACGWVFLVMNLALAMIIFFMVYWNRTFRHHEITTIALAAYTFTAFTVAVINIIKYRKYNSPVYTASKSISLTSACVSMLTLTSTMLTTFGNGEDDELFRRVMLAVLGCAVSIFVITMAIYMIAKANNDLRELKNIQET